MLQGHKNSGKQATLRIVSEVCPLGQAVAGPLLLAQRRPLFAQDIKLTNLSFAVISVAPSPQGELFATGSGDLRARIWR
jgi:hypothetical protein